MALKGHYVSVETRKKISEALKAKGFKPPSGKDKVLSEEHKKAISKALKGRYISEKTRRKLSEANKGKRRYGIPHTEETKRKLSNIMKGKKGHIAWNKGLIGFLGNSKHWNWKGGISSINRRIRETLQYKQWRQQVFIRDKFACQKCKTIGGELHVHHIKSFVKLLQEIKKNLPLFDIYNGAIIYNPLWNIDNGRTLCKQCHIKTSKHRQARGYFS